jgi:hypothetical protein
MRIVSEMNADQQKISFEAPLRDLNELFLTRPTPVPEIFLAHRQKHGAPHRDPTTWAHDKNVWRHMGADQRGVFVHVLTRFAYGMQVALQALPILQEMGRIAGRSHAEQYASIRADTEFIAETCMKYRLDVAGVEEDREALTAGYRHIFDDVFPSRINALEKSTLSDRREQIQCEARLRTVYHVIGEGLGAITGVWGLNAALRELQRTNAQAGGINLPGLTKLIGDITLIQRRHIAFGLNEMGELARESYFTAVLAMVREFRQVQPQLDKMRDETFHRWGETFPFAIDKDVLASLGRKRVIGWICNYVLSRPAWRSPQRLQSLAEVL